MVVRIIYAEIYADYYSGWVFTFLNGTMDSPTPLKIFGSHETYNEKGSVDDAKMEATLAQSNLVNLPYDTYNPSNSPPVNESGTVSLNVSFKPALKVGQKF